LIGGGGGGGGGGREKKVKKDVNLKLKLYFKLRKNEYKL